MDSGKEITNRGNVFESSGEITAFAVEANYLQPNGPVEIC